MVVGFIRRLVDRVKGALGLGEEEEGKNVEETSTQDEENDFEGEPIPEGLPPDEIKRQVLDTAGNNLTETNFNSIGSVHNMLRNVASANQNKGLNKLSIKVVNETSMDIWVEASASEPVGRRIAWSDIFSQSTLDTDSEVDDMREKLSKASQASYAVVVVDGRRIGSISESGGGTHAEEALVRGSSWSQAIEAASHGVEYNGTSQISLLINRSPCSSCVQWLSSAIEEAKDSLGSKSGKVTFNLAATGTYRRQARMKEDDKIALKDGAQRMAERLGRPFDEVYKEQEKIWSDDLRSFSTEWVDDDGEEYSGLSDLATAGWRIAGLDAGQPMTSRQMEVASIAENLAEKFEWES